MAGVSEGKIIVDCATLSPERMILEEKNVISKGGRFMEAPVSGSKIPAELGQLIFLCGGDEALFHYLAPAFEAMGKAKFLYGPVGRGSEAKLIINMMMGSMLTVFSEGLLLAQSLQLPTEKLLQAVDLGAIANPLFKGKGASILSHNFSANFPLKHAQKDMR